MAWGSPWAQRQGPPRIDLLPRELVEQRLVRRQRSGIGAGFLVLLALLGLWYVLESRTLDRAQDKADQERAVATGLRAQRAQLQPLADLEAQIAAAEQLRTSVYRSEIRFSGVMRDISAIVPEDVWLTSMDVAFSNAGNAATDRHGRHPPGRGARPPRSRRAAPAPARRSRPSPSPVPGSSTSTSEGSCGHWPAGPRRADSRCTSTPTSPPPSGPPRAGRRR